MNPTYDPNYIPPPRPSTIKFKCPNDPTHVINTAIRYNDGNNTQLCSTCGVVKHTIYPFPHFHQK